VSDDSPRLYTAREIVLELFPATNPALVPRPRHYRLIADPDDQGVLVVAAIGTLLRLVNVERHNRRAMPLCCDFCGAAGNSRYFRFLRADVPGAEGRRWRYRTACVDVDACDARRWDDAPIDALLRSD
jgi:hypothetical protein